MDENFHVFFCISSFLSLIIIIISNIYDDKKKWCWREWRQNIITIMMNDDDDDIVVVVVGWLIEKFFWLLEKKIIQWLGLLHVGITIIHPSSLLLIKQHEYTYTHRERDCYIRSKQIGQKSNKNNNEVDIFTLDQFFLVIIHCE